jgi:hypothetical protein
MSRRPELGSSVVPSLSYLDIFVFALLSPETIVRSSRRCHHKSRLDHHQEPTSRELQLALLMMVL